MNLHSGQAEIDTRSNKRRRNRQATNLHQERRRRRIIKIVMEPDPPRISQHLHKASHNHSNHEAPRSPFEALDEMHNHGDAKESDQDRVECEIGSVPEGRVFGAAEFVGAVRILIEEGLAFECFGAGHCEDEQVFIQAELMVEGSDKQHFTDGSLL